MIPAALLLLVASLVTTAFCVRRLIDPACPACTQRAWRSSSAALCCERCGWSNGAAPQPPATVTAESGELRAA